MSATTNKQVKTFIILISILVPIVVAVLYLLPKPENLSIEAIEVLIKFPTINALLNGTTFFVLIAAFIAIKNGNVDLHRKLMGLALILSALFLIFYVSYHYTMPTTPYPEEASYKGLYYFVLFSHILISAGIIPLVLITFVRGLAEEFDKHKKIAKITWPLWLYVTSTGVIVYFMISPYYPSLKELIDSIPS